MKEFGYYIWDAALSWPIAGFQSLTDARDFVGYLRDLWPSSTFILKTSSGSTL